MTPPACTFGALAASNVPSVAAGVVLTTVPRTLLEVGRAGVPDHGKLLRGAVGCLVGNQRICCCFGLVQAVLAVHAVSVGLGPDEDSGRQEHGLDQALLRVVRLGDGGL